MTHGRTACPLPRAARQTVVALLAAAALLGSPRGAAAGTAPDIARLAGVLEWNERLERTWPWSGAWVFPIGNRLDFTIPDGDVPRYQVNRGVSSASAEGPGHQGADLANGRAGDPVRAAAHGVVARVQREASGGYGVHVVIAHRLDDGRLAYSVYAHLLLGSVRVGEGAVVHAGDPIARVGQTGRATTPHLHFEVRVPEDSTLRWEKCTAVDPVRFVSERVPLGRIDTWSSPWVEWAEFGGLAPLGVAADAPIGLDQLRRMIGRAAARDAGGLDRALGDGALASSTPAAQPLEATWDQVSRGIRWLASVPRRLAPNPRGLKAQRLACEERLGIPHPAREPRALTRRTGAPTLADCCLLLADLAPPAGDSRR